jgi:AlwI restriction endonuclease
MSGRPFKREEQQEFLNELVQAGLVDSNRVVAGDDGGRKFASAFKQLGFVTDWERGKSWDMTPVGLMLVEHPELEELIFLRQLMKYQIPSPLESGSRTQSFQVRPFRLLLRFLKRAQEENLIGLTKFEIALHVISVLDENYEIRLRDKLRNVREIQFYRKQCSTTSLDEIRDPLEDIDAGTKAFFGGSDYAPAFLEWGTILLSHHA